MNRNGGAMIMIFQTRPITFFNSVLTIAHFCELALAILGFYSFPDFWGVVGILVPVTFSP
jgi:hypothetical protein